MSTMPAIIASSPRLTAANGARALLMFALALFAFACGGGDTTTAPGPKPNPGNQTPAAVASISMTPSAASLAIAGTQQLTVTLRDASGVELTGRSMSFNSSAPNVASVSQSGLVTA